MQSDGIIWDRKKPTQSWDRKLPRDTDFKEPSCFQRWLPGPKQALPGILKNQHQEQRRTVLGFEAELQVIGKSGGFNKDESATSSRKERAQGRDGVKGLSILGHGEIHSPGNELELG